MQVREENVLLNAEQNARTRKDSGRGPRGFPCYQGRNVEQRRTFIETMFWSLSVEQKEPKLRSEVVRVWRA